MKARVLSLIAALSLTAGCTSLNSREAAIIRAWMNCFECVVEREQIVALGQLKPQALIDSLGPRVLNDPILPFGFANGLHVAFVRDSQYRATHGMPASPGGRPQYVQERIRRFVEGQRARAGEGLGYMHNPAAIAVLDAAIAQPALPADLRRMLRYSRDSLP